MTSKEERIAQIKQQEAAREKAKDPVFRSLQNKERRKNTIERLWSLIRLKRIVSHELLTRFERAKIKYRNNYRVSTPEDKIALNEMMIRAYDALEQDAINQGFIRRSPSVIFTKFPQEEYKEYTIGIVTNDWELPYAMNEYMVEENVVIFSVSELLLGIDDDLIKAKLALIDFHPTIREVRRKKKNESTN
jgi:hypothetical protein